MSINLTKFSLDGGDSVDYVYYRQSGGVTNIDNPLGSTGGFTETADTGYLVSGSLRLNERWALNAAVTEPELDASDEFLDASGRLVVFQAPFTTQFDGSNRVDASYDSELSKQELNVIFQFNDHVDFIVGIGSLELDERFHIVSDDEGSPGVGTYTIDTKNEMDGFHLGIALNYMPVEDIGLYFIGKLGDYDNDLEQDQDVVDSPVASFSRTNSGSSSATSSVADLRLGLNFYLSEHLVIDVGYQIISIDDVALAENHFDTSADGSDEVVEDDIEWDGYSIGLKYAF